MIEAALRVIEDRGVHSLTLDAVAEEAGVTKRGLIYHFPSKSALILGLHVHLAERWDREMREMAGKEPDECSLEERTEAYVRTAAELGSRVDLRLIAEAGSEPGWAEPWEVVTDRWVPALDAKAGPGDDQLIRCLMARMTADGLWSYEIFLDAPLKPELRQEIVERIIATFSSGS